MNNQALTIEHKWKFKVGDILHIKGRGIWRVCYTLDDVNSPQYLIRNTLDDTAQYWECAYYLENLIGTYVISSVKHLEVFPDQECNHNWKHYNGFTESYEYCEFCQTKRRNQ